MSFYIFSKQHSYDGVAGFWKPNRNGYTNSIFEAGMYSREEAKEIVQERIEQTIKLNKENDRFMRHLAADPTPCGS